MDRSIFGSAIKTYPSKNNRVSRSYRPSSFALHHSNIFDDDDDETFDVFDKLVNDERRKNTTASFHDVSRSNYTNKFINRQSSVKPSQSRTVLQDVRNTDCSLSEGQVKVKKKIRTKHRKPGKENLKYQSKLYLSDEDSEDDPYVFNFNIDGTRNLKKQENGHRKISKTERTEQRLQSRKLKRLQEFRAKQRIKSGISKICSTPVKDNDANDATLDLSRISRVSFPENDPSNTNMLSSVQSTTLETEKSSDIFMHEMVKQVTARKKLAFLQTAKEEFRVISSDLNDFSCCDKHKNSASLDTRSIQSEDSNNTTCLKIANSNDEKNDVNISNECPFFENSTNNEADQLGSRHSSKYLAEDKTELKIADTDVSKDNLSSSLNEKVNNLSICNHSSSQENSDVISSLQNLNLDSSQVSDESNGEMQVFSRSELKVLNSEDESAESENEILDLANDVEKIHLTSVTRPASEEQISPISPYERELTPNSQPRYFKETNLSGTSTTVFEKPINTSYSEYSSISSSGNEFQGFTPDSCSRIEAKKKQLEQLVRNQNVVLDSPVVSELSLTSNYRLSSESPSSDDDEYKTVLLMNESNSEKLIEQSQISIPDESFSTVCSSTEGTITNFCKQPSQATDLKFRRSTILWKDLLETEEEAYISRLESTRRSDIQHYFEHSELSILTNCSPRKTITARRSTKFFGRQSQSSELNFSAVSTRTRGRSTFLQSKENHEFLLEEDEENNENRFESTRRSGIDHRVEDLEISIVKRNSPLKALISRRNTRLFNRPLQTPKLDFSAVSCHTRGRSTLLRNNNLDLVLEENEKDTEDHENTEESDAESSVVDPGRTIVPICSISSRRDTRNVNRPSQECEFDFSTVSNCTWGSNNYILKDGTVSSDDSFWKTVVLKSTNETDITVAKVPEPHSVTTTLNSNHKGYLKLDDLSPIEKSEVLKIESHERDRCRKFETLLEENDNETEEQYIARFESTRALDVGNISNMNNITMRRKIRFQSLTGEDGDSGNASSELDFDRTSRPSQQRSCINNSVMPSIHLETGKKWRRSFITFKNIMDRKLAAVQREERGRFWNQKVQNLISLQNDATFIIRELEECSTLKTGFDETAVAGFEEGDTISAKCGRPEKARFPLSVSVVNSSSDIGDQDSLIENVDVCCASFLDEIRESLVGDAGGGGGGGGHEAQAGDSKIFGFGVPVLERSSVPDAAREIILLYCQQNEPLPFETCFSDSDLRNCKKIGEGVYGEVFMLKKRSQQSVLKIIPIEGDQLVNGEKQKKFEEILSELVITVQLSTLKRRRDFYTECFAEVINCRCVYGRYPQRLISLWKEYDLTKGSENDSPKMFKEDQLYIILELNHGGEDVESFAFNNAQQTLSVFNQVTNALAVAEQAFMFEHRDLHWGNVLVTRSTKRETKFIIGDRENTVKLHGVKVTIIDYTLSRISINNRTLFNNMGLDSELFIAEGDFQFEVYRLMRDAVNNVWNRFVPKTNVYWLFYLLDKMLKEIKYRRSSSRVHEHNLDKIKHFCQKVLDFDSAYDIVCSMYCVP